MNSPERNAFYGLVSYARNVGVKRIAIRDGSIVLTDYFDNGTEIKNSVDGQELSPKKVAEVLYSNKFKSKNWRDGPDTIHIPDNGDWVIAESVEGITIKQKGYKPNFIDALVSNVDDEGVERIRSRYDQSGFDILVFCEGRARANRLQMALATERASIGLRSKVIKPPKPRYWSDHASDKGDQADKAAEIVSKMMGHGGDDWTLTRTPKDDALKALKGVEENSGTNVFIVETDKWDAMRLRGMDPEQHSRPLITVSIWLEDSEPQMSVRASRSIDALPFVQHDDTVWEKFRELKDKREARDRRPKIWHPTKSKVAEAFVKRKSPKGMVSGKPIFFYGPVAYSLYPDNPIAAFVDLPNGSKAVFTGRANGIGGTQAAVVTAAQADIRTALSGTEYEVYPVDSLDHFLTLDGVPLCKVPKQPLETYENIKSCTVDTERLGLWIEERLEDLDAKQKAAFSTHFPTLRKSNVWRGYQGLAELRDKLQDALGCELPYAGDADVYEYHALEEIKGVEERQEELIEKRRSKGLHAPQMGM